MNNLAGLNINSANRLNLTGNNTKTLSFGERRQSEETEAGKVARVVDQEIRKAEKILEIKPSSNGTGSSLDELSLDDAKGFVKRSIKNFTENVMKALYEDPLMGVLNKRAYQRDRVRTFVEACKEKKPISVVSFDLDKFKSYNDEFGHQAGDVALQNFGRILKETLGEDGKVYRVGGEELIALIVGKTAGETGEILENIRKQLEEETVELKSRGTLCRQLTVSIGFSTFETDSIADVDVENLLQTDSSKGFKKLFEETFVKTEKLSDELLYIAKRTGRNKVVGNYVPQAELTVLKLTVLNNKIEERREQAIT